MAHTITEIKHMISSGIKSNYKCINIPLIDIELDHVTPKKLHTSLRIRDILFSMWTYFKNEYAIFRGGGNCQVIYEVTKVISRVRERTNISFNHSQVNKIRYAFEVYTLLINYIKNSKSDQDQCTILPGITNLQN